MGGLRGEGRVDGTGGEWREGNSGSRRVEVSRGEESIKRSDKIVYDRRDRSIKDRINNVEAFSTSGRN